MAIFNFQGQEVAVNVAKEGPADGFDIAVKVYHVYGVALQAMALQHLIEELPALVDALHRLTTVCQGAGWLRHPDDALAQAETTLKRIGITRPWEG